MQMERCDICHKLIKLYNYNHHYRSHLLHQPVSYDALVTSYDQYDRGHSPPPTTLDDEQDDPVQPSHDSSRIAPRSPSHSSAQPAQVSGLSPGQQASRGPSSQPNAFQMWLKNPTNRNTQQYTIIDGQMKEPDTQAQLSLRQGAEILRRTTREEVVKIVNEFEGFPSGLEKKACLELVQKAPILPGLVAYTYTHLAVCPRHGWFNKDDWSVRVKELNRLVETWSKFGDVLCILSFKTIKNRLLHVLRATKVRPEEHRCNSALLNGTTLLSYDVLNLAALVVLYITGPQKDDILDQRGTQADELVELFHNLLEADVELDEEYRTHFLNPLIHFSKDSGYCPGSIYLEERTINGLVSVSRGGFGVVYKGNIASRLVAVKALKRDGMNLPEYNQQVAKEATIWKHLRHPNCLPFYGAYRMSTEGPDICVALVSPWMDHGTLLKYLECNPNANQTQLILDVTRGLYYLHSMQPHVAHRDIKPDNILITRRGRACLADFGLVSTFDIDDHFHTATSQIVMAGTYRYMAPEIFSAQDKEARRKVNKRACDMYALGCTIYAAYTGRHPFDGMNPAQIPHSVISGKRPEFPEGKITPDMWSFVESLWGQDPSERLTAEMAVAWMETKARQECVDASAPLEEEWEWKGLRGDGESLWSVSF